MVINKSRAYSLGIKSSCGGNKYTNIFMFRWKIAVEVVRMSL